MYFPPIGVSGEIKPLQNSVLKKEFHPWSLEKRVAPIARKSSWLKPFYASTANPTSGRKYGLRRRGLYRQKGEWALSARSSSQS
jgi:hypothetical protein